MNNFIAMIIPVLLITLSCHKMPKEVWVEKSGLYPEGLEYDSSGNNFFVTSLKEGIIGKVDKRGHYTKFIEDPNFISAIGIRVDNKRNKLFVANSDPGVSIKTTAKTQKKIAGLGIFNLKDGKLIKYVDLGALLPKENHFANDIALEPKDGSVYVTDSFSPVIYKVSTDGDAQIFLQDKKFEGKGFNLNGIVLHNDYLIVAKDNDGTLFKIPLNNPKSFKEIDVDQKMEGADGLLLDNEGNLIVSANGSANTVYLLKTGNNFDMARVVAYDNNDWRFNTTGILVGEKIYILNAELNMLFGGKPDVVRYEIRQITF
ncbi:MAG: gluconolaconase [Spirochaetia bacterium]|nr:gluconolaconase [Spirochaetia bacterium]